MGKKQKTDKPKKVGDSKLFALARKSLAAAGEAKKWGAQKAIIDGEIVEAMQQRRAKTITESDTGLRITFTQAEKTTYDGEGLRSEKRIKKSIKDRIFRKKLDISLLPKKRQEELRKVMLEALSPAELAAITSYELDVDEMSKCVQEGKLDAKVVAAHATITKNKPYCTISSGGAK